jgi:pSer/pThr/pTyr-binding forkhead associated (FHA) protein
MMADNASDVVTIGRGVDNNLVIGEQSVSLHHATFSKTSGRFWLTDLGSSNGTYVNGQRITETTIEIGDIVSFGLIKTKFNGVGFPFLVENSLQKEPLMESHSPKKTLEFQKKASIVVLLVVLAFLVLVRSRNSGLSTTEIARATVSIIMEDTSGEYCWSGSGALILDGKYVVTNAHVAAFSTEDEPKFSGCKVLTIGLSDSSGLNPSDYVGGFVAAIDTERDLALIELNVPIDSRTRKSLFIKSGDIGLESKIRVFGYPGIGGNSLTVSSGIISGLDRSEKFSYFKVSADISGGNSGGPVVDNKGQLVGIATALARQRIDCSSGTTCYSDGNGLGLVRPISLVQPLLSKVEDK